MENTYEGIFKINDVDVKARVISITPTNNSLGRWYGSGDIENLNSEKYVMLTNEMIKSPSHKTTIGSIIVNRVSPEGEGNIHIEFTGSGKFLGFEK
jgi:radical SAM superfamily enzyme